MSGQLALEGEQAPEQLASEASASQGEQKAQAPEQLASEGEQAPEQRASEASASEEEQALQQLALEQVPALEPLLPPRPP